MKSRQEIIAEMGKRKYSSYMSGAMIPTCSVDVDVLAWILDDSVDNVYNDLVAAFQANVKKAYEDYKK